MLTGIVLIATLLPNVLWVRGFSEMELADTLADDHGSPISIISSGLLIVSVEVIIFNIARSLMMNKCLILHFSHPFFTYYVYLLRDI